MGACTLAISNLYACCPATKYKYFTCKAGHLFEKLFLYLRKVATLLVLLKIEHSQLLRKITLSLKSMPKSQEQQM
jgi:hypothetical protein